MAAPDPGRAGRRSADQARLGALRHAAGPTDLRTRRPFATLLLVLAAPAALAAAAVAYAAAVRPDLPGPVRDVVRAAGAGGSPARALAVAVALLLVVVLLAARVLRRTRRWLGVFEGGLVLVEGRRPPLAAPWAQVGAVHVRPRRRGEQDPPGDALVVTVTRHDRRTLRLDRLPGVWADAARQAAAEHARFLVDGAVTALAAGRDVALPGVPAVRLTPSGVDLGRSVVSWQILGPPAVRPHGAGGRLEVRVDGDRTPRATLSVPGGLHSGAWALRDLLDAGARALAVPGRPAG